MQVGLSCKDRGVPGVNISEIKNYLCSSLCQQNYTICYDKQTKGAWLYKKEYNYISVKLSRLSSGDKFVVVLAPSFTHCYNCRATGNW